MFQITNVQSFAQLGIEIKWRGTAENEIGIVASISNEKLQMKKENINEKDSRFSNLEFGI